MADLISEPYVPYSQPYRVSSQLRFSENTLRYTENGREVWSMSLSGLAIVGQCTASWGPLADGFHLVFVSRDGVPQVAPYDVDGAREFVETLPHIEKPFTLSFAFTNAWSARVVYPASLAGQPLLELVDPSVIGADTPVARGLGSGSLEAVLAAGPREYLGLGPRPRLR